MVLLGLLLLVAGAVLVVLGLFTSDVTFENSETKVQIANIDLSTEAVFLAGAIAATLILLGLWAIKVGAKQGWRHRKEQKRLNELSQKLDRVELERRREDEAKDGDQNS